MPKISLKPVPKLKFLVDASRIFFLGPAFKPQIRSIYVKSTH